MPIKLVVSKTLQRIPELEELFGASGDFCFAIGRLRDSLDLPGNIVLN
jgi:hypothetical protein